ncbi:hypothetical protein RFI_33830, partial [Reticulomyxa filosa]
MIENNVDIFMKVAKLCQWVHYDIPPRIARVSTTCRSSSATIEKLMAGSVSSATTMKPKGTVSMSSLGSPVDAGYRRGSYHQTLITMLLSTMVSSFPITSLQPLDFIPSFQFCELLQNAHDSDSDEETEEEEEEEETKHTGDNDDGDGEKDKITKITKCKKIDSQTFRDWQLLYKYTGIDPCMLSLPHKQSGHLTSSSSFVSNVNDESCPTTRQMMSSFQTDIDYS